jgi:SpoVK/Ycf46/Vps4 family AAA+-type ATPase
MGLSKGHNPIKLDEVMLPPTVRGELQTLLSEFKHSSSLQSKGFNARRKLLFTGPPGCGKSLTAQALANALHLPHFVVRFDSIIGSYLGQTAGHLRHIFRFAEASKNVLLFDEIDALGKQRGNPTDVGELDRIVIALMQELELGNPLGLLVATSNLPEHLDRALWRRFDAHIEFPAPQKHDLRSFAVRVAQKFGRSLSASTLSLASSKNNYAEAEKVVLGQIRHQIISELDNKDARRH